MFAFFHLCTLFIEKEQEEQPRGDVVAAEDVEQQPEEEEGEGDIEEEEEEQTELRAPLGDWWARIYTYDEVIELLDELLPKKHKKGMKGLLTKGAKKGKGKGRKGKVSNFSIFFSFNSYQITGIKITNNKFFSCK